MTNIHIEMQTPCRFHCIFMNLTYVSPIHSLHKSIVIIRGIPLIMHVFLHAKWTPPFFPHVIRNGNV